MLRLGLRASGQVADALYIGLVTDTGRFMYDNTGSRAHAMAADLIDAGVDVARHLPPALRGHAVRQAAAPRGARSSTSSASTTAA